VPWLGTGTYIQESRIRCRFVLISRLQYFRDSVYKCACAAQKEDDVHIVLVQGDNRYSVIGRGTRWATVVRLYTYTRVSLYIILMPKWAARCTVQGSKLIDFGAQKEAWPWKDPKLD
jgi:hypothetical protein